MAFIISKTEVVTGPPITHRFSGTANEAFTYGEALVLSNGLLTKAGATVKPSYICLKDVAAMGADVSVNNIPVITVTENLEFETTSTAAILPAAIGTKVTLHTDGLKVTATATNGVFTILETSNEIGGICRGKFI